MGHTYDGKNSLYDRYGNSLTLTTMRNEFEGYINKLDIFKKLNKDNIGLVNSQHRMTTLSFYRSEQGILTPKKTFYDNDAEFRYTIVNDNYDFIAYNSNYNEINSKVVDVFDEVAKLCNRNDDCKSMFDSGNKDADNYEIPVYDTKYNLIQNDDTKEMYFTVVKGNVIKIFPIKLDNNKKYYIDDNDIISKSISKEIDTELKGYGKEAIYYRNNINGRLHSKDISIISDCNIYVTNDKNRYGPSYYKIDNDNVNGYIFNDGISAVEPTLMCYYTNDKYKSIEEIAGQFIIKRSNNNNNNYDNLVEFEIIGNLAAVNLLEKTYPVSVDKNINGNNLSLYKFNTIINDGPHFPEHGYAEKLCNNAYSRSNIGDKYKQCKSRHAKRKDSETCKMCNQIKARENININELTVNTLKMFKELNLDSKILPFISDVNDINDLKLLYKDATSIDEVWMKVVETFNNNKNFFDKEQSKTFIKNFNKIINYYILKYTNSDYKNDDIYGINGLQLNNMISSYFDAIEIYENKYNESIDDIELYPFNEFDSQSLYNKEKFKSVMSKLSDITGIDLYTIIRSDDPKTAMQNLCEKVKNLDEIDEDLYHELNDLRHVYNSELYKNDETSLNSEMIHMLYKTVASKMGINVNDENILSSENNLRAINNNVNSNNKRSKFEEFTDSVAFMILAAGRMEDGFLAREYDENGDLVPISVKILVDGEEKSVSIKDIIPSLRNLKGEELERKYEQLYELAFVYFLDKFESYYNEEERYAVFRENSMETIKKSNAFRI